MSDNRWDEFSDAELKLLSLALGDAQDDDGQSTVWSLEKEVDNEIVRRYEESVAPTYQGPGYYTNRHSGTTMRVVGAATCMVVRYALVGNALADDDLWGYPMSELERRSPDGARAFEFSEVGP